ncbi:MAG TPA: aspartate kinase [Candidatus Binatus sp.]|nr:aspartate kinase [Candidatus Binatus sp.]
MTNPLNNRPLRAGLQSRHFASHHPVQAEGRRHAKKPVRVLKFGGTSVGNASSIAQVVEIIRTASRDSQVVVVVSAMSGVTNQLVEAARQSESGEYAAVAAIFESIRRQHEEAIHALVHSAAERSRMAGRMKMLLEEGDRFCQGTSLLGELTPRSRDAISGLGERLSAPLVAAALAERGVVSEAIEATELVVTDDCHGGAEPAMEQTRERCETRLRPLLDQEVVPVVTGFIGSTPEGVLTTLGRGGSDYSATILAAALQADEVIIWTDVDGLHTADPRLVEEGCTIPEISYREASELAYFGARVLHPKTLRAVTQCGIPLWIRNTFAPERAGTKITPAGPTGAGAVKALSAMNEVVLIKVGGPGMAGVPDVLGRTVRTTAATRADVLLISQSSSQNELSLVIPSALAKSTVAALRHEFAAELAHEKAEHIAVDTTVAIVSVVGQMVAPIVAQKVGQSGLAGILGRACSALDREQVNIIAIAQGSSQCTLSFLVGKQDMKTALLGIHREFQLGNPPQVRMDEDATGYEGGESMPFDGIADPVIPDQIMPHPVISDQGK